MKLLLLLALLVGVPDTALILREETGKTVVRGDARLLEERYPPASTFKIVNLMVGVDNDAIPGRMKWDGVVREIEAWNQDHDLMSAFRASAVWYFQEIARRVGPERMQQALDRIPYGNRSLAGGQDRFWLDGGLLISPWEQLSVVQRLAHDDLPFSPRAQQMARDAMLEEDGKIRGKTGWARLPDRQIGWWVGWLESPRVYFVLVQQEKNPVSEDFGPRRRRLVREALEELGYL